MERVLFKAIAKLLLNFREKRMRNHLQNSQHLMCKAHSILLLLFEFNDEKCAE